MSTARHQLAGAPGTGTTIDNMASRVKMWAMFNQVPTTPIIYRSLNISSLLDGGVGFSILVYAAVMVDNTNAVHASSIDMSWGVKPCGWAGGADRAGAQFFKGDVATSGQVDSSAASCSSMGTLA